MKGIGYIRASTSEQKVTLKHQESRIRAYAEAKDITLIDVIVDVGKSGKNLKRSGVQKVLWMVEDGLVGAVIIYKIDRMFRSTVDALQIANKFRERKVSFHSICESIDTASPWGKFFYTLVNAFAELERNVICERTREAMRHLKTTGKVYGHTPYGYKRKGNNLIEDRKEREVIELIQYLRAQTYSYSVIARELNLKKIKTKKGVKWSRKQIRDILIREGGDDFGELARI